MKVVKIKKKLSDRTNGCPETKSYTPWCYRTCALSGIYGRCGRVAPHAILGRTQLAILKYHLKK